MLESISMIALFSLSVFLTRTTIYLFSFCLGILLFSIHLFLTQLFSLEYYLVYFLTLVSAIALSHFILLNHLKRINLLACGVGFLVIGLIYYISDIIRFEILVEYELYMPVVLNKEVVIALSFLHLLIAFSSYVWKKQLSFKSF